MATVTSSPGLATAAASGPEVAEPFDASAPWRLHPQVALRPERFGALAYHFGTRRLSFLKSPRLLAVVGALGDHPSAHAACAAAGVSAGELPSFTAALGTLARTNMIVPRNPE